VPEASKQVIFIWQRPLGAISPLTVKFKGQKSLKSHVYLAEASELFEACQKTLTAKLKC